jgi:hypothetical protein
MSFSQIDEISEYADGDVSLTEPEVVHNLLLDGVTIIRNSAGGMRAVGWEAILDADGRMIERRVVLRFTLAADAVARTLGEVRRLFGETIGQSEASYVRLSLLFNWEGGLKHRTYASAFALRPSG